MFFQFFDSPVMMLLWCLVILMSLSIVGVIFSESIFMRFKMWLNTDSRLEIIKSIGFGIGIIIAIMSCVNKINSTIAKRESNRLIEKGHMNDRLQDAIDNLGHEKRRIRIASFNQFHDLAKENTHDFRKNVFDNLCKHLRHITSGQFYKNKKEGKHAPTDECQALLNILFKPKDKSIFDEFDADLQNINLPRADLSNANLAGAKFSYATLTSINFARTNLVESNFFHADLLHADFKDSIIKKAKMCDANLPCAMFNNADLSEADFTGANLSSANFQGACLVGADLSGTNLAGANFRNADLTGAYLIGAITSHSTKFSNANLTNAHFLDANLMPAYLMSVRSVEGANFRGAKVFPEQLPDESGKYIADWTSEEF